jgi:lipopolysaccharide assembly protein A
MRLVVWLLRAFIFFALFAFALNNQQPATVHWFFGVQWQAPMVILVLAAFAAGCAIGVLAMAPHWWRQRKLAREALPPPASVPAAATAGPTTIVARSAAPADFSPPSGPHPPRDGV